MVTGPLEEVGETDGVGLSVCLSALKGLSTERSVLVFRTGGGNFSPKDPPSRGSPSKLGVQHQWEGQRCCPTPLPRRSPQGTTWLRISVCGGLPQHARLSFCHSHPGPVSGNHSEEMEEVPLTLTAACEG